MSGTEGRETGHEAMDQMQALPREQRHRRLSPGATAADAEDAARKLRQELFRSATGQELTRRAAEVPHRGVQVVARRRKRHRTGDEGGRVCAARSSVRTGSGYESDALSLGTTPLLPRSEGCATVLVSTACAGCSGGVARSEGTAGDRAGEWIWRRAARFLGVAGVEVIEIVDRWHARHHLWCVAHTVFSEGSVDAGRMG